MLDEVAGDFALRRDWTRAEIAALFALPFADLLWQAQQIHRRHHAANEVELATLLSIKTGGCAEDCGYCSQSHLARSDVAATALMTVDAVLDRARAAAARGSQRFCMGAAWRSPKDRDMDALCAMIRGVKALGLQTCMTLGMLDEEQAQLLGAAGLDFYNHNIDTSPEFYGQVISTRSYQDRLETLARVRAAGLGTCCGGILGMGESRDDRIGFLHALATLPAHPDSVPLNALVPVRGTAIGDAMLQPGSAPIDDIEFVRTVAVARILMPASVIRLSAGRESMPDATQALCFLAGAGSIFTGDTLLTTPNAGDRRDAALFDRLGLRPAAGAPA